MTQPGPRQYRTNSGKVVLRERDSVVGTVPWKLPMRGESTCWYVYLVGEGCQLPWQVCVPVHVSQAGLSLLRMW